MAKLDAILAVKLAIERIQHLRTKLLNGRTESQLSPTELSRHDGYVAARGILYQILREIDG